MHPGIPAIARNSGELLTQSLALRSGAQANKHFCTALNHVNLVAGENAIARAQGFNKRAPRVDLRRPAILVDSEGYERGVTILDISSGGFRLEVSETPKIGEFVTIRVERGEGFAAQIRWALGNEAGGVFLTSVDREDWT